MTLAGAVCRLAVDLHGLQRKQAVIEDESKETFFYLLNSLQCLVPRMRQCQQFSGEEGVRFAASVTSEYLGGMPVSTQEISDKVSAVLVSAINSAIRDADAISTTGDANAWAFSASIASWLAKSAAIIYVADPGALFGEDRGFVRAGMILECIVSLLAVVESRSSMLTRESLVAGLSEISVQTGKFSGINSDDAYIVQGVVTTCFQQALAEVEHWAAGSGNLIGERTTAQ